MRKIITFIFLTCSFSVTVSANEVTLADLKRNGLQAYENNDCIGAIKFLYAYRITGKDLSPDKLKNIDDAISYCENSLSNLNAALRLGSSSGYLFVSNGSVKPINVGASGVLITLDDQIIPLDTSTGGVFINSNGVMMKAPEQIESILWGGQSLEYHSLNSVNDVDILLKKKEIEVDVLNKYKKLYESHGELKYLKNQEIEP
ncbi:hypothetical protein [Teredinibacter turnerae]|uniref:hypothetical protein n=1 Tax=Teredinibacter turnerae TaxID=2426 RepID=UPI00037D7157|nr:hypothetical protein [Teredinibacter turnerae]